MITHEIVAVTPELAKSWLKKNGHNRPISRALVRRYQAEMENGRWMENGEPIILSLDETVLDGQHRLTACANGNVVFKSSIIKGVAKEAFSTIDTGKKRTAWDVLNIAGYKASGKILSTAAIVLMQYDIRPSRRRVKPENDEILQFVETHAGLAESATVCSAPEFHRLGGDGPLTAVHFLYGLQSKTRRDQAFRRLAAGERDGSDDPIWSLRERMLDIRGGQKRRNAFEMFIMIMKFMTSEHRREPAGQVKMVKLGRMADFPEFK